MVGLGLLFLSLFLDWYTFQIYNLDKELVVSWQYNLFREWITPVSESSGLNESLRPPNLMIPLSITILFIVAIVLSGYIIIFKNFERASSLNGYSLYAYILLFLLLLVLTYIIIYPIMYLIPQELYFPFLQVTDYDAQLMYLYSIGPGYCSLLISFPLIFPYIAFYYKTITNFGYKDKTPEKQMQALIEKVQEPLDIDRMLAQEELKQQFSSEEGDKELNNILTSFMEGES